MKINGTDGHCLVGSTPILNKPSLPFSIGAHRSTLKPSWSNQNSSRWHDRASSRICCSATSTSTVQREEYRTFTNTSGQTLRPIADNVWAADRPFLWNSIDVGGRMAVLRLSNGSLWVHSPVQLDDTLAAALDELGDVKHIVSPNYEHVKYAPQWMERYPNAKAYACPGLQEKTPGVTYSTELGTSGDEAPAEWLGEVEALWLSYERNPFNGKAFFNEVVFFFKPARLLITADLFWNYPQRNAPGGTAVWKFGMDRVYLPFYRMFMIRDKGEFDRKIAHLEAWDFDAILPCHGDYVPVNGKAVLRRHLGLRYVSRM